MKLTGKCAFKGATALGVAGLSVLAPPPPAYFGVTQTEGVAWLSLRLSAISVHIYDSAITLQNEPAGKVPTTVIRFTSHPLVQFEPFAAYAKKRPWTYLELSATHDVLVTNQPH